MAQEQPWESLADQQTAAAEPIFNYALDALHSFAYLFDHFLHHTQKMERFEHPKV